jgi:hypothetical protein
VDNSASPRDVRIGRNSDQAILKNNRAFALIATDRPAEAVSLIASVRASSDATTAATGTATSGFLEMRFGDREYGVNLYRDVIAYFKRSNNAVAEAGALAYFAVEAARAELSNAPQILEEARTAAHSKTNEKPSNGRRKQGHAPLVARVRHLNDKKKPDHWRSA